jgi:hypothetical protein
LGSCNSPMPASSAIASSGDQPTPAMIGPMRKSRLSQNAVSA